MSANAPPAVGLGRLLAVLFRRRDHRDPASTRPRPRSTTPSARAAAASSSTRARWKRRPSASPASSRRCAAPSRPARWSRISSRSSTCKTRRTIGFETLARWTDRDLGSVLAGGLHPDRRGARHHRPAVAAGAAQGRPRRPAAGRRTCSCPSTCRRRSSSTRTPACTYWRSSTAPASIRAGWRSRSPKPA